MASSSPPCVLPSLALWLLSMSLMAQTTEGATPTWCVATFNASDSVLQTALDYACGAGADCTPIQIDGLCYLPNTLQSHASYAFNSYYQRKSMAPGSCDFAGTAAVALTNPSYGSCVYPSSASTAGGTIPVPSLTPTINNPIAPPGMTSLTPPTISGLTPLGSTSPDESPAAPLPSSSLTPLSLLSVILLLPIQ